jgi:hypothetical protein
LIAELDKTLKMMPETGLNAEIYMALEMLPVSILYA